MAKQARILIVEDEAIVAEDLEMTVTNIGYEVVGHAASADEAVKMAVLLKPDLILMDIVLIGRKNGIDASHGIKEKTDIPVIFLTAYTDIGLIDKAKSTEPYAYLVKPFQERQLFASIEMGLYKCRAERDLKASEERLRLVVESMPVMLDAFDEDGQIISWNHECEKVTGFCADELRGNPEAAKLLYPDKDYEDYIRSMLKKYGGNFRNLEWDITCKDGSVKTILWSNISEKYPIPGWYSWAIGLDISERKRAEEALRESEKMYHLLANNTVDCIWLMNLDFEFTYVNPSILQMVGFTPEEWVGSSLSEHCSPEDMALILNLTKEEQKKSPESCDLTFEMQLWHKNGEKIDIEISNKLVFDDAGTLVGFQGATRDITERKHAEEQVKTAYRLREHFLKETSHRIITPVAIIGGYTDLLEESADPDEQDWEVLKRNLNLALDDRLGLAHRLAGKYRPVRSGDWQKYLKRQARVVLDNEASDFYTIVEVYAEDRIGLLYDVTRTLADFGLNISRAKIGTKVDQVVDVFYVQDKKGQKISTPDLQEEIRNALLYAVNCGVFY